MLNFLYKKKFVFLFMVFWAIILGMRPNLSYGGMVESKSGFQENRDLYLEKIKKILEDEKIVKYMERIGIDRERLWERIEKLETNRLRELAMRCDMFKVGGSAGGVVLAILFIILLIIALLYFTNYTIKIEPRDAIPRRY